MPPGVVMTLFLITFFLIYGSANGYFLLRARHGLALGSSGTALLSFWLLLMVAAPLMVRFLERSGNEFPARIAAYSGYCWMGYLFLFVSLMLLCDFFRAARYAASFLIRVPSNSFFDPRALFIFCSVSAFIITLYSLYESANLKVEPVVIKTSKLPSGVERIRIVQISDLHIGLIVGEAKVRRVVELIKNSKPDLVVATGDIVDGYISHFDGVSSLFREIKPRLGMIAVPGNHEYYAGFAQSKRFLEASGFRLLRGEGIPAGGTLWVVGVDDIAAKRFGKQIPDDETKLIDTAPKGSFVLLLKHRPVVVKPTSGSFDLQLSGHVHKGQLFPFNLVTWLRFPVKAGLTRLKDGSLLYVSRGTGNWGPPMRFLAPPEVTVIDLVSAEK